MRLPAIFNSGVARTVTLLLTLFIVSCATSPGREPAEPNTAQRYTVFGKSYSVMPESLGYLEIGIASWYGSKFHGRSTSNGEIYDMYELTAAHKALPLPTMVSVTNLDNGRKTIVRVNDRGPFHDDRVIDLSYSAALALGFADKGTAPVVVEAVDELNYPDIIVPGPPGSTYYLQVGAFSSVAGARSLLRQVEGLLDSRQDGTEVRILESEIESGLLHKVWIGPIMTELDEHRIALLLSDAALDPIKVELN